MNFINFNKYYSNTYVDKIEKKSLIKVFITHFF